MCPSLAFEANLIYLQSGMRSNRREIIAQRLVRHMDTQTNMNLMDYGHEPPRN